MKKLLFIIMFVLLSFQLAFADRIPVPSGSIRWDNFRDNYFNVQTEELYNFLGALDGELPESPTFDSLIISGSGNSWLELGNNTSFTDVLTGKGGYGLLNWLPYAILNGEQKRLALFEELSAGDTSVIQDNDPTLASPTGKFYSRASGGYFNVVHGVEMFAIAGTRTADTVAPVIVAGADSTHDGSTPVTATMTLTELYPDPSTLIYTVTGGTPASGTWAGTYPNYSVEITPTGTDNIVVTSSGSDLAGNAATGTDLSQTLVYDDPEACATDSVSTSNTATPTSVSYFGTYVLGQSFQVPVSGSLSAIGITTTYTTDVVLEVRYGTSTDLGTTYIATQQFILKNGGSAPINQKLVFTDKESLSSGTTYYFACKIITQVGTTARWQYSGDEYANGSRWNSPSAPGYFDNFSSSLTGGDFLFQVYLCD